jgi:hypothetical protein
MKETRSKEGTCALCGKEGKLSFEHVPPQSAFNNSPVFLKTPVHLFGEGNQLYGKKMRSNRGSGGFTLCEECNNKTGSWYASDFADFVHQGMKIIRGTQSPNRKVEGIYKIKPLNVLKQILTMFLSIDKTGHLRSNPDLVNFILHKEYTKLPFIYNVYLYSTLSVKSRMLGFCWVAGDTKGMQKWSEISFKPFGYFLTEESLPPNEHVLNISGFGNYSYDQEVSFGIKTNYLNVDSVLIGTYK